MSEIPRENAVEVRRRLLKGALGASTVVTLGYGGAAAAASISCLEKIATGGGFPAGTLQFTTSEPLSSPGANWGWIKVKISKYKPAEGKPFDGFTIPSAGSLGGFLDATAVGDVYSIGTFSNPVLPPTPVAVATVHNNQVGYENYYAWLLAYFHSDGTLAGTYPTIQSATPGASEAEVVAPATESCYTSINPNGGTGGIVFGG